ncbi:MAG TPA: hypothetical protein VKM94_19845 [Blastocatellia bacterium]|nr:hypothetical protein [Blastocatellia bacterium]
MHFLLALLFEALHHLRVSCPFDAALFGLTEGFRVEESAALIRSLFLFRLERMVAHCSI